jgi:hypothetical protein
MLTLICCRRNRLSETLNVVHLTNGLPAFLASARADAVCYAEHKELEPLYDPTE